MGRLRPYKMPPRRPPLPRPATMSDGPHTTQQPLSSTMRRITLEWFRYHWVDVLWMVAIAGICWGLSKVSLPLIRNFPIILDVSGDVVYPSLSYPNRGWIIPAWLAACLSIGLPATVYAVSQIRLRSVWDADSAIMGTIWAVLLATFFQVTTKTLVGGFRPYFLSVCKPDTSLLLSPGHNDTGLNGVGFHQMMYTTEICTEADESVLRNAMTSFPSGHSAAGFAGYGFLHLWLNAKLKVWADYRPVFWKLLVTMLPLLLASLNACILTVDGAHHWYDVLAGSIVGVIAALGSYRATHAAIWDWRYNHLHLHGRQAFIYDDETRFGYAEPTLTGKVG